MSRLWPAARRHGFDLLIVIAALESTLAVAFGKGSNVPTTSAWFAAPAIACVSLVLLGRRRFPFAAPAALWLLAAALSFIDGRLVVFTLGTYASGLGAAALLGNLRAAQQARAGLGIVVGAAAIVVYNDPSHTAGEYVFIPAVFTIAWLAGFALRERAEQAEAAELRAEQAESERDAAARIAVAEERARIARELHDIVAHAVSVMVLQVGAVRHQLPATEGDGREALEGVERTGRNALAEMRRLLGAMRRDDEEAELAPQPGLGSVEHLLEEVRRAGLPVELHVEGQPGLLPRGIELSAYRIVQEALTNALKHAGETQASVRIRYGPDSLELEIVDHGSGAPAPVVGGGHGLVGMRERVALYGGRFDAGRQPSGGFVVRVVLPI
ncbi:MAG: sensor histidine kinase [Gaiellaceae bacterium]